MLDITISPTELWDEKNQEFIYTKEFFIKLEHSLVSISKWESKWNKPFLTNIPKTMDETKDYVRCMTINQNVDPKAYEYLSDMELMKINEYISAPMTATTFLNKSKNNTINSEQITSELIYYWMVALQIPSEYQKWHLNRLLTLIRVCNVKNTPREKLSKSEIIRRNSELNEIRRKQLKTNG